LREKAIRTQNSTRRSSISLSYTFDRYGQTLMDFLWNKTGKLS
jgi:hypothetical protein